MHTAEFLKKVFSGRTPWTYFYVFLIPFVNWSFAHVPSIPMPDGGAWPPLAIVTGFILVARDFAQREVGHHIFVAVFIGMAVSFLMAPPAIAIASAAAFLVSEVVDWAIYTFSKRPLSERVLISSVVAAPLDTTLFWGLASLSAEASGTFTPLTLVTAAASKLVGAYVVYLLLKQREKKAAVTQEKLPDLF
ncbi:VUT family protein [Asticcacaulis endophyticus]|uniref:Vitamin uptake transporter n=1 Tax=Asticcacaulis endophyticus TaxID=1395890 RepID=A0A918PQK9_9CAUL|nr:VUT family protein [Asticcacaulis endophyticus]GGZ19809.1 hypothetical protein GCM10011273_00440 [Asticcacaulis endophyticus]